MGVVYISYICRSIATVVHCGVMIWAMSLRMEGRGHLLHLPPLCCSPNVWMRSSLQLGTLRQMDNISNKPPPGQPSGSGTASFTLNVFCIACPWGCGHRGNQAGIWMTRSSGCFKHLFRNFLSSWVFPSLAICTMTQLRSLSLGFLWALTGSNNSCSSFSVQSTYTQKRSKY